MLPFGIMKRSIEYGNRKARIQGKKIKFVITTNGILLTREKIKFFKKNNTMLIISLDGQARSHNINRPQISGKDSYSLTTRNLPLIFKDNVKCYCYTVITPETAHDIVKNFHSLIHLGFKNIWIMMACGPRWKKDKITKLKKGLASIARSYPGLLKHEKIVLLNLKNWLSPVRFNTELSVNIDGSLYSACLTYLIKDENVRRKYVIGHIDKLTENIDSLDKKRISNREAIDVIYKENNLTRNLKNNIYVGNMFSKFSEDLKEGLKENGLWYIYESLANS